MKKCWCFFGIIIVLVLAGCESEKRVGNQLLPKGDIPAQVAAPTQTLLGEQDILYDYNYLIAIIRDNYPFLQINQQLNGVDWLEEAEKYKTTVPTAASTSLLIDWYQKILVKLNNRHSGVITQHEYPSYIDLYSRQKETEPWSELLNNPAVKTVYKNLSKSNEPHEDTFADSKNHPAITAKFINDQTAYINLPSFATYLIQEHMKALSSFLKTIGQAESLILDIRSNSGGNDTYWMTLVKKLIAEPINWTYYNLIRGTYIKPFIEAKVGLVFEDIPNIQNLPTPVLSKLPQDVVQDFSGFIASPLQLKPEDSIQFKGRVYLLVGPRVFSSSEKFASFAKSTGWATLVGERTGGDGLGIDPALIKLPRSNLIIRLPLIMGVTEDGIINEEKKTEPNIWVNSVKSSDLLQDMAVKAVLEDHPKS